MRSRLLLVAALLTSFPAAAERVRVVVAVGFPEMAMSQAADDVTPAMSLRSAVLATLPTVSDVTAWGADGTFSAEIDAREVDALRRDPRVRAVSIDTGGEGAMLESLGVVRMDLVRPQGLDGTGVTVAILDTGIETSHPDFAGRIVAQQCFCENSNGTGCCPGAERERFGPGAAEDDHGHGTHVTGIIAGAGVIAPMGIAPKAEIISVKVMDSANSFRSFAQIYRGLDWILTHHPEVDVINMSLGSFTLFSSQVCDNTAIALGMDVVIKALRARGVLVTASSGNQASLTGTTLPACMTPVLGVGATFDAKGVYANGVCSDADAQRDEVTCFTNSTDSVDIVAPGAMITSAMLNKKIATWAGTSMAAPHVAGAIALMKQRSRERMTSDEIETVLKTTGTRVTDARNGLSFPRLDISAAISATPKVDDKKRRGVRHGG